MSLFNWIYKPWNQAPQDGDGGQSNDLNKAALRTAVSNTQCRFYDFGFADMSTPAFYRPTPSSGLPSDFKVCEECFIASIAPTALAKSFMPERISSMGVEELVECGLPDLLNEPTWTEAVRQGTEVPLVQRLRELAAIESNVSKCPAVARGSASVAGAVGFRVLKEQSGGVNPFTMCDYHYASNVQGTWMEEEFDQMPSTASRALCDFGRSSVLAMIALTLAKRSSDFKIFADWTLALRSCCPCDGIIQAGCRKYVLPAVQHATIYRFQVCETCYRVLFEPHTIIRTVILEVPGHMNTVRGECSINAYCVAGYTRALLKATWKENPSALLDYVSMGRPIPPCPGPYNPTSMPVWYRSRSLSAFSCCEACYHAVVLPSALYTSFEPQPSLPTIGYNCDMSFPDVAPLYTAACQTGQISAFEASLQNLRARVEAATMRAQQEALQPEADLSRVGGTPWELAQLRQLRDEINMLLVESTGKMRLASIKSSHGSIMKGMGNGQTYISADDGKRFSDGYGGWHQNQAIADGERARMEGQEMMKEGHRLTQMANQKRFLLAELKRRMTPLEKEV